MNKLACIFVTTPFQMISALSILEQYSEYEFDLYIIGNFSNYREIESKIKKEGLFTNVILYTLKEIRKFHKESPRLIERILRTVGRQLSYIKYEKIGKQILVPGIIYEKVFFAAANSSMELLMCCQKLYRPEYVMYDDGVMSYRNPSYTLGKTEKICFIKNVIFSRIGQINASKLLYLPELYKKIHINEEVPEKLITASKKSRQIQQKIFDLNKDDEVKQNVIVIECLEKEYLSNEEADKLEKFYHLLLSEFGVTNVIFKKHPRDIKARESTRIYMEAKIPFESYNCIQNFKDKILIAWDSTAVMTSKLFFNQEPIVILLYNLVKGVMKNQVETDAFYKCFRECYKDSHRFFIPETEDELRILIQEICREYK